MLGLLLDVAVLWAIASVLAKRNMSEDIMRFLLFAGVLIFAGIAMMLGGAPPPVTFAVWFAILLLGMKFWLGANWLGATIGASLFLAYRVILAMMI